MRGFGQVSHDLLCSHPSLPLMGGREKTLGTRLRPCRHEISRKDQGNELHLKKMDSKFSSRFWENQPCLKTKEYR